MLDSGYDKMTAVRCMHAYLRGAFLLIFDNGCDKFINKTDPTNYGSDKQHPAKYTTKQLAGRITYRVAPGPLEFRSN